MTQLELSLLEELISTKIAIAMSETSVGSQWTNHTLVGWGEDLAKVRHALTKEASCESQEK